MRRVDVVGGHDQVGGVEKRETLNSPVPQRLARHPTFTHSATRPQLPPVTAGYRTRTPRPIPHHSPTGQATAARLERATARLGCAGRCVTRGVKHLTGKLKLHSGCE